eukprot:2212117-Lingulodinium_polyedra.AAC.1
MLLTDNLRILLLATVDPHVANRAIAVARCRLPTVSAASRNAIHVGGEMDVPWTEPKSHRLMH